MFPLALAGCDERKVSNSDPVPTTGAREEPGVIDSGPASLSAMIQLNVTGGPMAGQYSAEVAQGGCTAGLANPGSWANQYVVDTQDPRTFSSLQLLVPNAEGRGASDQFMMTVTFGPVQEPTEFHVETRGDAGNRSGSGTVLVEDNGNSGKVVFDARTADGVGLQGTITCRSVIRGEG